MKHILNISSYNEEDIGLPTQSPFLWFRAANRKLPKLKLNENATLDLKDSTQFLSEPELKKCLLDCTDVSNIYEYLFIAPKCMLRFNSCFKME